MGRGGGGGGGERERERKVPYSTLMVTKHNFLKERFRDGGNLIE